MSLNFRPIALHTARAVSCNRMDRVHMRLRVRLHISASMCGQHTPVRAHACACAHTLFYLTGVCPQASLVQVRSCLCARYVMHALAFTMHTSRAMLLVRASAFRSISNLFSSAASRFCCDVALAATRDACHALDGMG
jgi:hypothetical protein